MPCKDDEKRKFIINLEGSKATPIGDNCRHGKANN